MSSNNTPSPLELEEAERAREAIVVPEEDSIVDYYTVKSQLTKYNDDVRAVITHPRFCLPFLQPGRLAQIRDENHDFGWGCIVNFQKKLPTTKKGEPLPSDDDKAKYVVDVLLYCDPNQKPPAPCAPGEKGEMVVVPCMLTSVDCLSSVRIYLPKDIRTADSRQSVYKAVQEVKNRFKDGLPLLDPVEDMNIEDESFKKLFAVFSSSSSSGCSQIVSSCYLPCIIFWLLRKSRLWKRSSKTTPCPCRRG